jgi:SNF2 family DNA or RNA helicase
MVLDRPVLVLATKRICEHVWKQEAALWSHLCHLRVSIALGTPAQRRAALEAPADIYCINYENLVWLIDELGDLSRFEVVVFDEISKMKSAGAKRHKKIRRKILDVPMRIGMTGTPRGNSMLGLWAQMWCIDGDQPLGETYTDYRDTFFSPVDPDRYVWRLKTNKTEEQIVECVAPWVISVPLTKDDVEHDIVPRMVTLPPDVMRRYRELEQQYRIHVAGHDIDALEAVTMTGKLNQIASGAVYASDERGTYVILHAEKIDALADIVDDLQGAPLLVFFNFRHELERIQERFGKIVATKDNIDAWLAGDYQMLAVHPASAGHGLNLHVGGASCAVWMSLPTSAELWEQANRRLARKGQKKRVTSLLLTAADTVEGRMARALATHMTLQDAAMAAVEQVQ